MPVNRLQQLVATGQYLAAYREVERLALDPDLDPSLRAKVFTIGVRAAAGLREVYSAVKMAEKAIEYAELGSNWDDIGNARYHAALIYRELGDTAQSLRFFDLFFQYLDRYPSLQSKTASAYYNKGLTHQQRREFDKALESYKLAIEDYEQAGNRRGMLMACHNRVWLNLMIGNIADAEPDLALSQVLCSEIEIPEYQAAQLVIEALYARRKGNVERAMALCEEIFHSGRPGVQDSQMACASWIMAGISLDAARFQEASIFSDFALNHALQAKDPILMNLASEIRHQILLKKNAHSA